MINILCVSLQICLLSRVRYEYLSGYNAIQVHFL
jgi:hypothetical protein